MDKNSDGAPLLDARGVVKTIRGRPVLSGVSLEVRPGEVHVLAGPNGAGKTTTMRVILGLARRDSGVVRLLGVDPEGPEARRVAGLVGYLPEDARPYGRLTGWENLYFYALVYAGGDRDRARRLAMEGARISGLPEEALARRASTYSKGMARRLLLARAVMHRPRLAVLDEPTSGLDVFSALRVRGLIRRLAGEGAGVLLSTHNLLEAQEVADRVTFISGGRTLCTCTVGEALDRFNAGNLEEAFVAAVGGGHGPG
ncbi:MAG: ABC transporter ATP-binding protein [Desulfurococcales archaeon]|nr:ABC transporter ATP-binding protein [Desulfurococcales archaeon]